MFTLEVLLLSAAARDVVPAILSSAVAAAVAWPVLGNQPTYLVPPVNANAAIVVWAVVLGPVAAVTGSGFVRLTSWARRRAPKAGWRLPVATTVVFTAVGAVAIGCPALLGNGKGPAQIAFDGALLGALTGTSGFCCGPAHRPPRSLSSERRPSSRRPNALRSARSC